MNIYVYYNALVHEILLKKTEECSTNSFEVLAYFFFLIFLIINPEAYYSELTLRLTMSWKFMGFKTNVRYIHEDNCSKHFL